MPAAHTDHATSLRLELLSGLLVTHRTALPNPDEWIAVLSGLPAIEGRAVVLSILHGMTEEQIGERLEVTRTRAWQRLRSAYRRLRATPAVLQLTECRP